MNLPPLPRLVLLRSDALRDPLFSERKEWWLSMGDGGYLSGTPLHSLSRGYNGLSVIAEHPPVDRILYFVKWDGFVSDGTEEIPITTNHWSDGSFSPAGHRYIESFRLEGRLPHWTYRWKEHRFHLRIWFDQALRATCLSCLLDSPAPLWIRAKLYFNRREHHRIVQGTPVCPDLMINGSRVALAWEEKKLTLLASGENLQPERVPYRSFFYVHERERGLSDWENHCHGLTVRWPMETARESGFLLSDREDFPSDPVETVLPCSREAFQESDRRLLLKASLRHDAWERAPDWLRQLLLTADSFIADRRDPSSGTLGKTIIAGFPWFGDWGRDTMIALPGLLLATGRYEEARLILLMFSRTVHQGLLPNFFPDDGGDPVYNTADASLWYLRAVSLYGRFSQDYATVRQIYPVLLEIVSSYLKGTAWGIGVDPQDGLVRIGDSTVPLTWMDARVQGLTITPRIGKPVELSALWYNGLLSMADTALRLREDGRLFLEEARKTREGFQRFVRPDGNGLLDILDGSEDEGRQIRPNQILALSLEFTPLETNDGKNLLRTVGEHLLTPFGLRSLSRDSPQYIGVYQGSPLERDSAYHQGTVWGWLLGHYAMSHFRVHGDGSQALSVLEGIADHLHDAGMGGISEIFDGDPPHLPKGCPLQAWSVGCTLEAWLFLESRISEPLRSSG
ncbi:MAG: amylo-alpha-1,6-glucosidase [Leptospirales bacterium]